MRISLLFLSGVLAVVGTVVLIVDYSNVPVESACGLQLGRFHLVDDGLAVADVRLRLDQIGYAGAAKVFGPALQRDPGSAYRWSDFGEGSLAANDFPRAALAYDRARQLAPHDVLILFDAGDFYSSHGKPAAALEAFSIILRETGAPKGDVLTQNVFTYYENLQVRQKKLFDQAIPDAPNARAYLKFLMAGDRKDSGAAVLETWKWLSAKRFDDDTLAADYTRYMIANQQFEAAEGGWEVHFRDRNDGYPQQSRVFNGGFEYEFQNSPLDWRFDGYKSVRVQRDRSVRFEGKYSVRFNFDGNDNPDFHHFGQQILLRPGRYHFTGHLRTAGITSDEGIRFRALVAGGSNQVRGETLALSGTHDWTLLTMDFEVLSGMPVIDIEVSRHRSLRLDNQLQGTAWVDAVRISRLP